MKGYEKLSDVFTRAHKQASEGKGAERHATEAPFHEQPMMQVTGMVGSGFPLGQAIKKIVESQGMPPDRAVNELLGAICYLAGGIIHLEAANDNQPQPEVYFEPIMKHETVEYLDEHYNLIDVGVGTIIPDNWIKVPEGAEACMDFGDGYTFYRYNFSEGCRKGDYCFKKCLYTLDRLKKNGGRIVWQRNKPAKPSRDCWYHSLANLERGGSVTIGGVKVTFDNNGIFRTLANIGGFESWFNTDSLNAILDHLSQGN